MTDPAHPPEQGPSRGHAVGAAPPEPSTGQPEPQSPPATPSTGWPPDPPAEAAGRPSWPTRPELRWALVVALGMALAGLLAGLLWAQVAPRLPFRVVRPGLVVATAPEAELYIAVDGWFFVITAAVGALAGVLAWLPRAARGVLMTVALSVGGAAGAVITRAVGHWLAGSPDGAALRRAGAVVLTPVRLRATAFAVAEGFVALLVYLMLVGFAEQDSLNLAGRRWRRPPR